MVADLDESILGDLTKEWLNAVDLKLSLGQQIKILRHVPTYLRSQRLKMMKRTHHCTGRRKPLPRRRAAIAAVAAASRPRKTPPRRRIRLRQRLSARQTPKEKMGARGLSNSASARARA